MLTLAYARGNAPRYHQSAHTLRAYKDSPPSKKAAEDLALMVLAATALHRDWDDHRALLDRFADPYDAAMCPVTSGPCPCPCPLLD